MRVQKVIELPTEIEDLSKKIINILTSQESSLPVVTYNPWLDVENNNKKLSIDIEEWTSQNFTVWFAMQYLNHFNKPYSIIYSRDCADINNIKLLLSKSGMDTNEDLKKYFEWTIDNSQYIIRSKKFFTLSTLRYFINEFIQSLEHDISTSNYEDDGRTDFIDEIKQTLKKGNFVSTLKKYGIPIISTYVLLTYSDFNNNKIDKIITNVLNKHMKDGDYEYVKTVARRSIINSPYPKWFVFRNWKEKWDNVWGKSGSKGTIEWRDDNIIGKTHRIEYNQLKR